MGNVARSLSERLGIAAKVLVRVPSTIRNTYCLLAVSNYRPLDRLMVGLDRITDRNPYSLPSVGPEEVTCLS